MNRAETVDLLTICAGFDQRTTGDTDITTWHAALLDVPFTSARDAVVKHYREHVRRVMPADIVALWRSARPTVHPTAETGVSMPVGFRDHVAQLRQDAHDVCIARRGRVLSWPDLAHRLTIRRGGIPWPYDNPGQWNGYIPAGDSPQAVALRALVDEAETRERKGLTPAVPAG